MVVHSEIVQQLPSVTKGDVGLYQVSADGTVDATNGFDESIEFSVTDGALEVVPQPGRSAHVQSVVEDAQSEGDGGGWTVLSFVAEHAAQLEPFLTGLFRGEQEKDALRADMDSMFSSSLGLMEEVSIVGEMLPKLASGASEIEVVTMGLEALVVAASIEAALFVRYDEQRDLAELLVHVPAAGETSIELEGDRFFAEGIAWRAIKGGAEALLESAPEGGHLVVRGSPESFASREVIAVPVRYGPSDDKPVTLGAILLIDKRPNAWASAERFGSQDTKLATSVAAMLGSVLGARKVAELGNELRNAHVLHQQILPDGSPRIEGFDLAGNSVSPGAVGGDYYDFLQMPDGRLFCVVADVSGHNLASCLVMVSARAALRLLASTYGDPAAVFDALADTLFGDLSRTELFITAVGAAIEPATKRIEIVNAGHNPTMIYRARTGEIEEIFAEDTILGFLPAPKHEIETQQLNSGDVVLLYTDGVTEAANVEGEFLEEARLRDILKAAAGGTAQEILEGVYRAVEEFADENAEGDDISVVVIKVK